MVFLAFAAAVELVPNGTLLIHIGMILLMIFILNRTFFRPINRIIESRLKNQGGRFTEAEEILNRVNKKQSDYDENLRQARSEGYDMIEGQRSAALQKQHAEVEAVKAETSEKFAQNKAEIDRQTTEARTAIAQQADELADKISANILKV